MDDKYYQNYHWGNSYKIVIDCYDEEKEIAVSEKEFHVIKIGDKILCNVYRSANRVVTVELNEHWKDAGEEWVCQKMKEKAFWICFLIKDTIRCIMTLFAKSLKIIYLKRK